MSPSQLSLQHGVTRQALAYEKFIWMELRNFLVITGTETLDKI